MNMSKFPKREERQIAGGAIFNLGGGGVRETNESINLPNVGKSTLEKEAFTVLLLLPWQNFSARSFRKKYWVC